jgi:hypothetical protein
MQYVAADWEIFITTGMTMICKYSATVSNVILICSYFVINIFFQVNFMSLEKAYSSIPPQAAVNKQWHYIGVQLYIF